MRVKEHVERLNLDDRSPRVVELKTPLRTLYFAWADGVFGKTRYRPEDADADLAEMAKA